MVDCKASVIEWAPCQRELGVCCRALPEGKIKARLMDTWTDAGIDLDSLQRPLDDGLRLGDEVLLVRREVVRLGTGGAPSELQEVTFSQSDGSLLERSPWLGAGRGKAQLDFGAGLGGSFRRPPSRSIGARRIGWPQRRSGDRSDSWPELAQQSPNLLARAPSCVDAGFGGSELVWPGPAPIFHREIFPPPGIPFDVVVCPSLGTLCCSRAEAPLVGVPWRASP